MKIHKNLLTVLFALLICFCIESVNAQSCKKSYLSAQGQYNIGRHESAQNLLKTCLTSFKVNKSQYLDNPEQVFKVYKLYIASCTENGDKKCVVTKRKELINFFKGKIDENDVLKRLNQTKI